MELWADGELYEEYVAPEDGLGLLVHYWTWSPETLSQHQLMVRAYDDHGQSAFSSVVHIEGIPDPGYVLITTVEDGDTILSIAERYSVSVEDILIWNPLLRDAISLAPGTEIFIHIGAPATSSIPSTKAKALMMLNEWTVNLQSGYAIPQAVLTAPTLTVSGQGCTATLSIGDPTDGEKGFNIYRLNPGAMSFTKLTSLPAHKDSGELTYQDANLFGQYHYYVAAFDDSNEAASNLVSLKVADSNCAGTPTTIDDLTSIPAGMDDFYLYIAINKGDWKRFPTDEFTYLKRSQNIDFNQVVSMLAPNLAGNISMRGEVWGMVNGMATLLGTFDKTFKPGQAPAMLEPSGVYQFLTTSLEVRGIPIVGANKKYNWLKTKGFDYGTEIFRWNTTTNATQGIWQVASVPFPKDASLNPACLLLTDSMDQVGTPNAPYEFPIDFSSIKPKTIISNLNTPFEANFNLIPLFSPPYSSQKLTIPDGQQQVVKVPNWSNENFDASKPYTPPNPCALNVSPEGIISYYVRILPMSNGQPAGKPSNTVLMTHDPTPPEPIKINDPHPPNVTFYDVKIVNFTGVHAPEASYENCVEVVENPYYPNGLIGKFGMAKPGDKVCPDPYTGDDGGFLDDLANMVESAINFISDAYDKLSEWAVKLAEELNPLCQAAKLTTQAIKTGQGEVKDACHYVAELAVAAAKTYVGLPPTLPNFDQLKSMGKDYLVDLAVQELESKGVPCPDACKQAISNGIDYSLDQVEKSMSNSACFGEQEAHEMGIEPLCAPKGVVTKPDPRGQPAPAVVEVQVTRRPGTDAPDIPQPTSCNIQIGVKAKNDSHIGEQWLTSAGYEWTGVSIEGSILSGGGPIPTLQPDKSTNFPIILKPSSYWLPGHKVYAHQSWKPAWYDDWNILYEGANAEVIATGSCTFYISDKQVVGSNVSVIGDSKQVGPLGKAWPQTCGWECPK